MKPQSNTPLLEFLCRIVDTEAWHDETGCLGVLEKVAEFLPRGQAAMGEAREIFRQALRKLGWNDVVRWIESRIPSYEQSLENLAKGTVDVRREAGALARTVSSWNLLLHSLFEPAAWKKARRNKRVLSGFSAAVDASFTLDREQWNVLLKHAAAFADCAPGSLLSDAFKLYKQGPADKEQKKLSEITELVAAILYAYEHPGANLKPTLVEDSRAEQWARKFFLDMEGCLVISGGGAAVNIADALGGLAVLTDVFWPCHAKLLADTPLRCVGGAGTVRRRWFDDKWRWKESSFSTAGGGGDFTAHEHPLRLSLILPFSPKSPQIQDEQNGFTAKPDGPGRLILQFSNFRPAEFFKNEMPLPRGGWESRPVFGRWRWKHGEGENPQVIEDACAKEMADLHAAKYCRVILSGFQWGSEANWKTLGQQCAGLRVHHEISSTFENRAAVLHYCDALRTVFGTARRCSAKTVFTAGMNDGELAAFTSWYGTDVFAAQQPTLGKDSFLQSFFRAMKVRETFELDWLYVHGNDIDIVVADPKKKEPFASGLRDAMFRAKAVVFAALHVRSGIADVPPHFGLWCAPKGILALCQFAREFARQFGGTEEEGKELFGKLVSDGLACKKGVPIVAAVPVYWPEPDDQCSMTGAGDICSGVMAALAP